MTTPAPYPTHVALTLTKCEWEQVRSWICGLLKQNLAGQQDKYLKSIRTAGYNAYHIIQIMDNQAPGLWYGVESRTFFADTVSEIVSERLPTKDCDCFRAVFPTLTSEPVLAEILKRGDMAPEMANLPRREVISEEQCSAMFFAAIHLLRTGDSTRLPGAAKKDGIAKEWIAEVFNPLVGEALMAFNRLVETIRRAFRSGDIPSSLTELLTDHVNRPVLAYREPGRTDPRLVPSFANVDLGELIAILRAGNAIADDEELMSIRIRIILTSEEHNVTWGGTWSP